MVSMRKSRLSVYKQDRLIEHFVSGSTARTAASLVGVNKSTAAYFYHRLREIIVLEIEQESKTPVFGLLKRGGRVYTKIIPDASSATLMPIIERKVIPDRIVYSDCWRGYNVLDVSDFKHFRINRSKLFADKKNHINGIENFWNRAKRHMRKFNGVPKKHFGLFLKECEWRFNNSDPSTQLLQLRQWVRSYLR
jgi:transposase